MARALSCKGTEEGLLQSQRLAAGPTLANHGDKSLTELLFTSGTNQRPCPQYEDALAFEHATQDGDGDQLTECVRQHLIHQKTHERRDRAFLGLQGVSSTVMGPGR